MNTMHGYGEYSWNDGRKYIGFYNMDKKEGFGIYIWNDTRAYIGFWKDGKQHGVGKYVNNGVTRFGNWQKGKRMSWFEDENDAISNIPQNSSQHNFNKLFLYDLKDIFTYFSG